MYISLNCCIRIGLKCILLKLQHEFIRDARSHERKIRIELKDFIDRMKKKKGWWLIFLL